MFRPQLNNKIGNLLNYLGTRLPGLSMTKALKLFYLIDETSYMRTGVPVTWLDYKVWEMGPVAEELYNELRYGQAFTQNGQVVDLSPFVEAKKEVTKYGYDKITITPKAKTDLSEFSSYELELIDNIIDRFGTYSSKQLIELLHEKNTLWHQYVSDNDLKVNFKVYGKKSNHNIDFARLIQDDPILQMAAQSAFESMQMQEEMDNL